MSAARERWIARHPYLEPLARFEEAVEGIAGMAVPAIAHGSDWEGYRADAALGIPLLHSPSAGVDCDAAGADLLNRLVDRSADLRLPPHLAAACSDVRDGFRGDAGAPRRALAYLLRGEGEPPADQGLLRYFTWTALAHVLAPVIEEAARRRRGIPWTRGICPTCGAPPNQGQLAGNGDARRRLLACGACRTRWSFQRIGCPFCGNEEQRRIDALEVAGEEGLRLDACQECKGYVKTYVGEGEEALFLADWSTLHLDLLAAERGYERKGASLYALE
jgi:FdhE protein